MREISASQVEQRVRVENPWWVAPHKIPPDWERLAPRLYLEVVWPLIVGRDPHRALVLLGPRRIGKTVLLHHAIQRLIDEEAADPTAIFYLAMDAPVYTGQSLSSLVETCVRLSRRPGAENCTFVFDEVQYVRDWERDLKGLVDSNRATKFIVSGSAAAALRMKSTESGAGRFTDFFLPPLTFLEFLEMRGDFQLARDAVGKAEGATERLNERFVDYVNFGGYPEALVSEAVRKDPARFIRNDVIDKVLLRDLPSLYGISDIQELNRLFAVLAWNTGQECSLEKLSKGSGVAKNTIKKYIDYLQAAFLIRVLHRLDRSARRFQRATTFKVYLTNPSMRAALFAPELANGPAMSALAETAILAQMPQEEIARLHYARWEDRESGEIDFVALNPAGSVRYLIEVKWTDRFYDDPSLLKAIPRFDLSADPNVTVTTLTKSGPKSADGVGIQYWPTAVYAVLAGGHLVEFLEREETTRR